MDKIAVIGAGQMGAGIAQVSARAGYAVYLSDISIDRARKGKDGIAKQMGKLVEKGKLDQAAADATLARIEPIASYDMIGDAGLVIEAATEREDIKRAIFALSFGNTDCGAFCRFIHSFTCQTLSIVQRKSLSASATRMTSSICLAARSRIALGGSTNPKS